jgi:hypothetical protein
VTLRYPITEQRPGNGMRVVVSEDRLTPVAALHLHHRYRGQSAAPGGSPGAPQPGGAAEFAGLLFDSIPVTRAGVLPGCAFHSGRFDPGTVSHIMWAEADAVSAAGGSVGDAVLAVAGDVSAPDVLRMAERYFGALPASSRAASVPVPDPGPAGVPWPVTALGFRLPAYSIDGPYLAAELALRIIADGPDSRAYRDIVQVMRAASQVFARFAPRAGTHSLGLIGAMAGPGSDGIPGKVLAAAWLQPSTATALNSPLPWKDPA